MERTPEERRKNQLRLKREMILMADYGWRLVSRTHSGTFKACRYVNDWRYGPTGLWSLKSTGHGGKKWALEVWEKDYRVPAGPTVPIFTRLHTHWFDTPLALALWFDLVFKSQIEGGFTKCADRYRRNQGQSRYRAPYRATTSRTG